MWHIIPSPQLLHQCPPALQAVIIGYGIHLPKMTVMWNYSIQVKSWFAATGIQHNHSLGFNGTRIHYLYSIHNWHAPNMLGPNGSLMGLNADVLEDRKITWFTTGKEKVSRKQLWTRDWIIYQAPTAHSTRIHPTAYAPNTRACPKTKYQK